MMHDVVIIGGGHNGLVCSAYLAMAGLKVVVLDQRPVAGGDAVTEEFSPGFCNSVASYAVSLLNPKIIRDLILAAHGLRIVERPISNFLPLGAGSFLKVGGSHTKREVAKFSARDAERLDDYQRRLAEVANVLRASVLETPPNVVEGSPFSAIAELFKAGRIAKRIRALGLDLQRDLLDLFAASAGDFLDGWFESAPIKAVFGYSVVGNYASPYTAGSAYVHLHHSFGEVNGKKGVWCHAIGGMGAITQAMAKAAAARGVDIRLSTRVRRVLVENGHAIGVVTDKGETTPAAAVAAGINPKLLYLHLVDARALPEGFRRRMDNWRCGSGTFRMSRCPNCQTSPPCPDARRRNTTPRASSSRRASPIWSGPISTLVLLAGRAALSLNWSFRRYSTARSRRVANMSRASSVKENSGSILHT
jgi:phytoene dehydrogenase-like protein